MTPNSEKFCKNFKTISHHAKHAKHVLGKVGQPIKNKGMKTLFPLDGKVALVTGAAQGLGAATVKVLAAQGARVAAADLNYKGAKAGADEIGESCRAYGVDVAEVEACRQLVNTVAQDFGRLDILVNNAGICPRLSFADSTEEDWEKLMSVNAKSQYFLCKAVCPIMKEQGGG